MTRRSGEERLAQVALAGRLAPPPAAHADRLGAPRGSCRDRLLHVVDLPRRTRSLIETLKSATFIGMASAAQFFVVVGGGIDLSIGSVATIAAWSAPCS